jgi:hypothetical protein
MGVVDERFRGTHGPPGKPALLGSMVDLFRRQVGDAVGHQVFDDMVPMCFNHFGVLVFGVFEVTGHAIAVQQVRQVFDVPGIEATRDQTRKVGRPLPRSMVKGGEYYLARSTPYSFSFFYAAPIISR